MRRHRPWWQRILLVGAAATFVDVLVGLIATGGAKAATLLIAADLLVSGVDATPDDEDAD